MKVDRRCPRCRFHGYHFAHATEGKAKADITCCNCGHRWTGRLSRTERDLIE